VIYGIYKDYVLSELQFSYRISAKEPASNDGGQMHGRRSKGVGCPGLTNVINFRLLKNI
jgi:hypothetical protein